MRHPVIKVIGYVLIGLVVAGLAFAVIVAALSNKPFYGTNYKGLALGTYTTLTVLVMACLIGVVWVVQWGLRRIRRRRISALKIR